MGRERVEIFLKGEEATKSLGERLAKELRPGALLALSGELGAGKTTFVKGLVKGLGGDEAAVSSPTFTYLHHYTADLFVYHFDLYRLPSANDFLAMGFDEMFDKGGVVVIEWPERIAKILPVECRTIAFEHCNGNRRAVIQ